jgi:hypothetical protein
MEYLIGTGLAVLAVGVTLFVALPPPWWPNMPRPLVRAGIAFGALSFLFGLWLVLAGTCQEWTASVCPGVRDVWDFMKEPHKLIVLIFVVFLMSGISGALYRGRTLWPTLLINLSICGLIGGVIWASYEQRSGGRATSVPEIPSPYAKFTNNELRERTSLLANQMRNFQSEYTQREQQLRAQYSTTRAAPPMTDEQRQESYRLFTKMGEDSIALRQQQLAEYRLRFQTDVNLIFKELSKRLSLPEPTNPRERAPYLIIISGAFPGPSPAADIAAYLDELAHRLP